MLVTTAWLAENLSEPDVVVLCINSTPEFYSKGHIPGARQIKLEDIAVTRDGIPNELPPVEALRHVFEAAGVSNSSRVVLYGERFNLLAARAYFTLDYLGVAARVALLDGGLEKWTAERRPLSTEIPQSKTATLVVSPRPEILVDTRTMRELSQRKTGSVTLLDARPTKEFTGEQLSEDVAKAGHIPGAKGLFWMDMLVSRQNPVLKPEAELRRMYSELNARADQPLVTLWRNIWATIPACMTLRFLNGAKTIYPRKQLQRNKRSEQKCLGVHRRESTESRVSSLRSVKGKI
jgi:thiosulfate/3-mercaptopyruvate sulfurtransferase